MSFLDSIDIQHPFFLFLASLPNKSYFQNKNGVP